MQMGTCGAVPHVWCGVVRCGCLLLHCVAVVLSVANQGYERAELSRVRAGPAKAPPQRVTGYARCNFSILGVKN